ncbi:MAG: hypothetical protein K0R18_417 [Bacillales bacterium]|jgi:tRNA(Ile2) C34 agmatinyltransferase TiaS|nr:hypothetical protein [Bacillales bacterium]
MELDNFFQKLKAKKIRNKKRQLLGNCKTCGGLANSNAKAYMECKTCTSCYKNIKFELEKAQVDMTVLDVVDAIDTMNELAE